MNHTEFETLANPSVGGRFEVQQRSFTWRNVGLERKVAADIYFYLLKVSWGRLLGLAFLGFVLINLLFAVLYYIDLEGVANAQLGSFSDAFFFSVQTFSTIGFGAMSPQSVYTHALVTIESFAGLVSVALATGLIYAKFARPTAAIQFSEIAVLHDRDGVSHLHMRLANERIGEIVNATIKASISVAEVTAEGSQMRRIRNLPLVNESIPVFTLNWTAMHEIDETSPLYGVAQMAPAERPSFYIILTFEGTDATMLQPVHARYLYQPQDIVLDRQYKDMLQMSEEGMLLNHGNLAKTVPMGVSTV